MRDVVCVRVVAICVINNQIIKKMNKLIKGYNSQS